MAGGDHVCGDKGALCNTASLAAQIMLTLNRCYIFVFMFHAYMYT